MKYPKTVYRILEWCTFLSFEKASYDINYVDTTYRDYTALMYATYYANLAAVESLIAHGANVDMRDNE